MVNFLDEIGKFIFSTKYAKYNEKEKRRETWEETVKRVKEMHLTKYSNLSKKDKEEIEEAFNLVKEKKVVPSMRSMQFGGKAVFAHEARLYNCAVRHIDSIRSFAESFYALLCGVGVDFGLSEKYMSRLPDFVSQNDKNGSVITYTVTDTIEGWADSVEAILMCYFKNTPFSGRKIVFDYSKIRAKGTPLKTGGGLAPGHEGLKRSHKLIKTKLDYIIESYQQKRMKTIDAYDILMYCSDAVLSGGIRRAACSVTFQKDDIDMMEAKTNKKIQKYRNFERLEKDMNSGFIWYNDQRFEVTLTDYEFELLKKRQISWIHVEPQRARSNNSVLLLRDKMTKEEIYDIILKSKEWGEPGFVFANNEDTLFNPCREIGFIPVTDDGRCGFQMCNLSSVNGSKITSLEEWIKATKAATIIGTLQAGYTNFPYLGRVTKELTEKEALLGVSVTGWFDNPEILLDENNMYINAKLAIKINKEWTKKININQAARITCTKPEGCLDLNTTIKTNKGVLTLNEIFKQNGYDLGEYYNKKNVWLDINHQIKIFDKDNNEKDITKLYINGKSDTLILDFDDGETFECTPNHKFLTNVGWIEAQNLTEEHEIISY
jgi:ribonucleoside-triphosphate reductase